MCTADRANFSQKLGPFMPGVYNIKAVLKGKYVDLNKNQKVALIGDNGSHVNLTLEGQFVSISCNFPDAKLFANGKDTGILIKDAKEFGPVSKDGSMVLSAEKNFPWGTIKSKEVKVEQNRWVNIELSPANDALKENLMKIVTEYNKSWIEAIVARDVSKLINVSDNEKARVFNDIESMKAGKRYYKCTLTKTIFDLDSVTIYKDGDKYTASIADSEYFDAAYYYETMNATPVSNNVLWGYKLVYDEATKKWCVDSRYRAFSFNPKNQKEF